MSSTNSSSSRPPARRISANAILNILGAVLPMGITLLTVPAYLHLIGDVRFGVLALVWVFLSYFAMFEMGLGRAVAKFIAELSPTNQIDRENVFWSALAINLGLGAVAALLLWLFATATLPLWIKADHTIQMEVIRSIPWLCLAVPLATTTSVLTGALEGCERFDISNAQQTFATILFQVAPLVVAYEFGPRVDRLIATAVLARLVANVPLLFACRSVIPLLHAPKVNVAWVRRLFSFGLWVAVSGIISPILTSLDRFIIAFVRGAQALTYYSIPFNLATKLSIIPESLSSALFPRLAANSGEDSRTMAAESVSILNSVFTPLVVVALFCAGPFFHVWLGAAIAKQCTVASQLIMLGVWANGLAQIPHAMLQAQGRPSVVAKLHMLELAPFVGVLWWAVHVWGVNGAALAWSLRMAVDFALLMIVGKIARGPLPQLAQSCALLAATMTACVLTPDWSTSRLAVGVVLSALSVWISHRRTPQIARRIVELAKTGKKKMRGVAVAGVAE